MVEFLQEHFQVADGLLPALKNSLPISPATTASPKNTRSKTANGLEEGVEAASKTTSTIIGMNRNKVDVCVVRISLGDEACQKRNDLAVLFDGKAR